MARARAQSLGEGLKSPHTVSLKVLRLTRPSLAQQFSLPQTGPDTDVSFPRTASLACPEITPTTTDFVLTPLLMLPDSFQSAYVGETFSCTLCANNELSPDDTTRSISGVRIGAEMLSPSHPSGIPLDLEGPSSDLPNARDSGANIAPTESLQRVLKLNLKEPGDHTLAVTVTYTETTVGVEGKAAGGKARTFRKLYQFAASSLIGVRTKAGDMTGGRYALEAQLENLGERTVVVETVRMSAKAPFKATSLNWDAHGKGPEKEYAPVLNPRDIIQIAFLLEEEELRHDSISLLMEEQQQPPLASHGDNKLILGQLYIQWRSAMGDRGFLSTGWLTGRKRS